MTAFRRAGFGRTAERSRLRFRFDGVSYEGLEGDTLASALLANGVHLVGRSFKYHRPRGIMSAGSEEANALVTFDRGKGRVTPNMRATTLELFDGLEARSQNAWPTLKSDVGAFNDLASMVFPAGFYNKTFMWPKGFWDKLYEPFIRRMAGLGPAPTDEDADHYAATFDHCETLVIGAGPAGLAAACAAADAGGRVILVDEQAALGGSLLSRPTATIDGMSGPEWVEKTIEALAANDRVTLLPRTTAIGYYHDNYVALAERLTDHKASVTDRDARERLHRVRAGKVVLAMGAIERPLVFADNDVPGVMLASAALTYLHRYGVAVGNDVVVVTSHDSAYEAAFALVDAGISIAGLIDTRKELTPELKAEVDKRRLRLHLSSTVTGVKGRHRVQSITSAPVTGGLVGEVPTVIPCDTVLMSGGWTPSLHLWSHAKGSITWSDALGAYLPDEASENVISVGACNGVFELGASLTEGARAGGVETTFLVSARPFGSGEPADILPTDKNPSRVKAFVDLQNDVTAKDIKLAVREGFKSIEHVKRYTTTGMATDQGKTSNLNGLQIASKALAQPVTAVGLTTFRPPYTPTTFGALAGNNDRDTFDVTRKTPIDSWAEAKGAVYEPVALWRRARYFPKAGEDMHAAVNRECRAVRRSVGIFDASTLGKIEVVGPDATEFMNRMYTNPWTKLAAGRCRYGLLLGEDGFIIDDGVIGRLADDRFHVTTTSGGAPRVLAVMEDYLQTEWPDLDVWLTSTTEQWAVIALNGPNARKVIEPLIEDIDLSPEAFPHMAVAEGRIAGVPTRLFRVSFTGELGFEINVPAHYGLAVWNAVIEAGDLYDICPYGTETMHVLRAEKGYIIVGQDTDGTVTPDDAGLSWAIGKKKPDFVGKRSLARPDMVATGRKQLVGLLTDDPTTVLEEGAQLVDDPHQSIPMTMIGHVTSSYWSEALGRSIALALVTDGRARNGKTLYLPMPDRMIAAKVTGPVFLDPKGDRLNAV